MIEDIILDTTKRMDLAIGHCKAELSKVRIRLKPLRQNEEVNVEILFILSILSLVKR